MGFILHSKDRRLSFSFQSVVARLGDDQISIPAGQSVIAKARSVRPIQACIAG
jgi:hypothetical protein